MARLSFRCDEDLVERVDSARGDVPRERWLRRCVEHQLDAPARREQAVREIDERLGRRPAEQPEIVMTDEVKQKLHRRGIPPGIAPSSRAPSSVVRPARSFAKRGVGPVPKGKG